MKIRNCRICNTPLVKIISFGKMPMVNYYLSKEEINEPEEKYSLTFCICKTCSLGQLNELVSPQDIFIKYHYASSVSRPLKIHLEKLAELVKNRFALTKNSRVLDIGCNDGVLLTKLKESNISILGIDPAKNIVLKLIDLQIPVIPEFFTKKLAVTLQKEKMFDVIFATNTLAQIVDVDDFVEGIKLVLTQKGIFIAEVGYLIDMITKKTFDSIYHEHYSYFSLQALEYLFKKHDLTIFDAQRIPNHGGSLRIFAQHSDYHKRRISKRLEKIRADEKKHKLNNPNSYQEFVGFCHQFKHNFRKKLLHLKKQNKVIVGVTSPAKGVIILNYCHIDVHIMEFIVDSTPYKQYRFMPGVHIPIFPENELEKKHADYLVILAWTYKEELLKKLDRYRKQHTNIIIPLPKLAII